jgi:hypothetical protein
VQAMSRGGAMPMTSPTGWVYLRSADCTIRWQRGDKVAYMNSDEGVEVLAAIPVSSMGWTDLADVRLAGENWVKAKRQHCRTCGVYS